MARTCNQLRELRPVELASSVCDCNPYWHNVDTLTLLRMVVVVRIKVSWFLGLGLGFAV